MSDERHVPTDERMAAALAHKVFSTGIGPGKTIRISLRGGELGTTKICDETDRGGLCEEALQRVLLEGLREFRS